MVRVAMVLALLGLSMPAQAQSCGDFWYRRNSIYREAGYCFKTPRAIRAFGNAGCLYDNENDVPLSARQRAIIADITAAEQDFGCPR